MWAFLVIIFVFGLLIGSFLNCLIWRLYSEETIKGRSYCPKCRHQISWYDNIPVLSFIFLKGKCRHCRKKISWQYTIIELTCAILFALAFDLNVLASASPLKLFFDLFLISSLIVIFVFDLRWMMISVKSIYFSAIVLPSDINSVSLIKSLFKSEFSISCTL